MSPEIWFVAGVRTPSAKVDGPLGTFDAISLFVPVVRHMIGEIGDAARVFHGRSSGGHVSPSAMDKLGPLFEEHGLLFVFGAVFLEQMGPPLPSGPLLIVAGALANEARVSRCRLPAQPGPPAC